ncbi:hypothetical protein EVAR_8258_1 [Eumeta japonica]|uniref:Uncharacterized protein n=1 Tax=Eumeta variegata TaxID=151549 RepID=A0A4C1TFQ6_EUMVA|nr:hypothetical protein EVAR_8258_1 [Eumeta japonica]
MISRGRGDHERTRQANKYMSGISRPAPALAKSSVQYSKARGREKERYTKVESRREKESESVDPKHMRVVFLLCSKVNSVIKDAINCEFCEETFPWRDPGAPTWRLRAAIGSGRPEITSAFGSHTLLYVTAFRLNRSSGFGANRVFTDGQTDTQLVLQGFRFFMRT